MIKRYFAWIDLETTGLVPEKGHILEIGCVITDAKFNRLDYFNALIKPNLRLSLFPFLYMNPFVTEMHTKNGLFRACKEHGEFKKDVRPKFYKFLKKWSNDPLEKRELYFMGNSIGALDIPFLKHHFPEVLDLVHYRSIDVTSCKLAFEIMNNTPGSFRFKREGTAPHRAIDDIELSMQEFKYFKNKIQDSVFLKQIKE